MRRGADGSGRRQVATPGDGHVAGRRQRHAELLEEDDHKEAEALVRGHELSEGAGEGLKPEGGLQPVWQTALCEVRERE